MKNRNHGGGALQSVCGQLALILLPIFLFMCGGVAAYLRTGAVSLKVGVLPVLCGVLLLAALAPWLAGRRAAEPLRSRFAKNRALFGLLAVSLLLRLPQWGNIPRDDGAEYYSLLYKACSTFHFGAEEFFLRFRAAAHPSWGLMALAAIPEFFMPGNFSSFLIFQTGISLAAVFCVYDMLRNVAGCDGKTAWLGAFCFGNTPMLLGLASYPSLELGMGVFFIFVMWAYTRRYYLLLVFCAVLTVASKEFGIVLLAGFCLGALVGEYAATPAGTPWFRRLGTALLRPQLAILWMPGLFLGLGVVYYLLFSPWAWVDVGAALRGATANSPGNFGTLPEFILFKGKELLFVNYNWLLLALCIGCLVWRRLHRSAPLPAKLKVMLCGALGAGVLMAAFLCVAMRLSYSIPRYNLALHLLFALGTVCLVGVTLPDVARPTALAALGVLLAVQAYLTVDPLMLAAFPQVDTGAVPMVRVSYAGGGHLGDYLVYNNQYTYQYTGLQKILAEYSPVDYDLVVLGDNHWIYFGEYGWDPAKKCLADHPEEALADITVLQTGNGNFAAVEAEGDLKSHAVLLRAPTLAGTETSAQPPDGYTNLQRRVWRCGLQGQIVYDTADRG